MFDWLWGAGVSQKCQGLLFVQPCKGGKNNEVQVKLLKVIQNKDRKTHKDKK